MRLVVLVIVAADELSASRVAKAKGRLRGKQPKLSPTQEAHLVKLYCAGEHTISELEELFAVTRSTVYRAVRRASAASTGQRRAVQRFALIEECGGGHADRAGDQRAGQTVAEQYSSAAIAAAAGMVSTQAVVIRPAIPQRTSAALPRPARMTPPDVT